MELTERLVPSRYIRDQLSKYGYQLSDLNKATMLWNTDTLMLSYSEKLSELKKLCDSTNDDRLKKQIGQRLTMKAKSLNASKTIFQVNLYMFLKKMNS